MRKILIIALLLVGCMGQTMAQQMRKPKETWYDPFDIYIGFKAGAAASNITKLDGTYRFGPTAGGYVTVHFTDHIGMSVEMGYSFEGTSECHDYNQGYGTPTHNYYIQNINTEYKLRYYPMKHLNVFSGFHFSKVISAKYQVGDTKENIRSEIHNGNVQIPFGVAFDFNNFVVEGSYNLPLKKLSKTTRGDALLGNGKINLFMLTLGYQFRAL